MPVATTPNQSNTSPNVGGRDLASRARTARAGARERTPPSRLPAVNHAASDVTSTMPKSATIPPVVSGTLAPANVGTAAMVSFFTPSPAAAATAAVAGPPASPVGPRVAAGAPLASAPPSLEPAGPLTAPGGFTVDAHGPVTGDAPTLAIAFVALSCNDDGSGAKPAGSFSWPLPVTYVSQFVSSVCDAPRTEHVVVSTSGSLGASAYST